MKVGLAVLLTALAVGLSLGIPTARTTPEDNLRLGGKTRFETAVAVSEWFHAETDNVKLVALANGFDFPDALTMGPNLSRSEADFPTGPLLLVYQDRLPEPTRAELERLSPCMVLVLGGENAVSDEVLDAARAFADQSQDKCLQ